MRPVLPRPGQGRCAQESGALRSHLGPLPRHSLCCAHSLCLCRCRPPAQRRAPRQLWPLDPRSPPASGPPTPSRRSRGPFRACLARTHPLPRHPHLYQGPHCLHPRTWEPLRLSPTVRNLTTLGGGPPCGARIPNSLLAPMAEVSCSSFWTLEPRSPSFRIPTQGRAGEPLKGTELTAPSEICWPC